MTCPSENELSALAAGTLIESAAGPLRSHVEGCDDCRVVLATFQSVASSSAGTNWPLPGEKIGRYALLSQLGAGAMGVVFLAFDAQLERKVALKFVAATGALDEARSLARLSHPNVVHVHEVLTHGAWEVIAMEYVAGETLRAWLGREHSRNEVLEVMRQAAEGLAAAHASGIVHRDFKPENVLVGSDGRVRVTDFGLSLSPGQARAARAGTPAYMSPEVLAGEAATAASDQYALSVTAIEAITGTRPAEGRVTRIATVPRAWIRGLSQKPDARWPSVRALLAGLRRPVLIRRAVLISALLAGIGFLFFKPAPLPEACRQLETSVATLRSEATVEKFSAKLRETKYSDVARLRALAQLRSNGDEADALLKKTCVSQSTPEATQLQLLRLTCLDRTVGRNESVVQNVLAGDGPGTQGLATFHFLQSQPAARCGDDRIVRAQASTAGNSGSRELTAAVEAIDAQFDRRALAEPRRQIDGLIQRARDEKSSHNLARLLRIRAALRFDDGEREGELADLQEATAIAEENGLDSLLLDLTSARMGAAQNATDASLWFDLATQRARRLGLGDSSDAELRQSLALAYWNLGEVAQARTELERAVTQWSRTLTPDDPMVSSTEVMIGLAHIELGEFDKARVQLTRGLGALEARMGADSLHLLDGTRGLVHLALWEERPDDAAPLLKKLETLRAASDGETSGAQRERALLEHWLATLRNSATPPLREVDDDDALLVALIDAQAALARGDAATALRVLAARQKTDEGPLAQLADAMAAEAHARQGSRDDATRLITRVLDVPEEKSNVLARTWARFARALISSSPEDRAAALAGSRADSRLRARVSEVR